jgi:hypothetical protein
MLATVSLLAASVSRGTAQTNSSGTQPSLAVQEKETCINNLKAIYDAIQAYKNDHQKLPNWLSDLVPQYLNDANVLICPSCLRTGHQEAPPLADPKLPSSYLFEFCPVRLGNSAPDAPNRTRREWKQRQMAVVGPVVPLVRCRQHNPVLNLSYDGKIYESPPSWEVMFTNHVGAADLTAAGLFATPHDRDGKPTATTHSTVTPPAKARPGLINLANYFNAVPTNAWLSGEPGDDLGVLPLGRQTFGGVEFDVRGIIQLGGRTLGATTYPTAVKSIQVDRMCTALHFLHAAAFGSAHDEGAKIGSYVIYYATNQMRLEIPIYYGADVRDWHSADGEPASVQLNAVWTAGNESGKPATRPMRLFMTTWKNVAPSVEIERIDFVSSMDGPAPFLLAITAE